MPGSSSLSRHLPYSCREEEPGPHGKSMVWKPGFSQRVPDDLIMSQQPLLQCADHQRDGWADREAAGQQRLPLLLAVQHGHAAVPAAAQHQAGLGGRLQCPPQIPRLQVGASPLPFRAELSHRPARQGSPHNLPHSYFLV